MHVGCINGLNQACTGHEPLCNLKDAQQMALPIIKYNTQENHIHVTAIGLPAFNFAPTLCGREASLRK